MSELDDMYIALQQYTCGKCDASGIPSGFTPGEWNVLPLSRHIVIYPPYGGSISIYPDGTWAGDVAPFAG